MAYQTNNKQFARLILDPLLSASCKTYFYLLFPHNSLNMLFIVPRLTKEFTYTRTYVPWNALLCNLLLLRLRRHSHSLSSPLLQSISPTFFEQLLCCFPFAKKLQTHIVSTEKLPTTLLYKKVDHKMLVKLTWILHHFI